MAQSKAAVRKLTEITECSICLAPYEIPKLLPCNHTFCWKCVKEHCKKTVFSAIKSCPLCRGEFHIPEGGVKNLPSNDSMALLVTLVKKAKDAKSNVYCWLCKELEEEIPAISYCVECRELCAECTVRHGKQNFSTSHKIMDVKDKPSDADLVRLKRIFCSKHTTEELRLYCCDCKVAVCMLCQISEHNKHECRLLSEKAEVLKKELSHYIEVYDSCKGECEERLNNVAVRKENLLKTVTATDFAIRKRCAEIRRSLDKCERELLRKLNTVKESRLKEITSRKDFDEAFLAEIETFLASYNQLLKSGTDFQLVGAEDDILKTAEELSKSKTEHDANPLAEKRLKFVEVCDVTPARIKDLIGELEYADGPRSKCVDSTLCSSGVDQKSKAIRGVTVVNNEIFAIWEAQSHIKVYDFHSLKESRNIDIPEMTSIRGLAGCSYNKALYISDQGLNSIHRVDLTNNSVTHWKVDMGNRVQGLSLTSARTLLVTVWITFAGSVLEYNERGQFLRKIQFNESIRFAWGSAQISCDQFVVCQSDTIDNLHRVCIINSTGEILKSYGKNAGGGADQLNCPLALTIDSKRNIIFVADCSNNRIVMFDYDLKILGLFNTAQALKGRTSLHIDSETDRLIVGERDGRLSFFSLNPMI